MSTVPQRPVALVDVDHTLLFGVFGLDPASMKLNMTLLQCLKSHAIEDIFLFTDMTFSSTTLEDRNALVTVLRDQYRFRVHGVFTPCDVCWGNVSCEEAVLLESMCFGESSTYKGKFFGPDFENFVCSQAAVLPNMAAAVKTYSPTSNTPGRGFTDANQSGSELSRNIATRSMFAKACADHLSAKLGYEHVKGLMLDLFLQHAPNWMHSVVVCDDNEKVNQTLLSFRPVDNARHVPPLTMLLVTGEDMAAAHYMRLLDQHRSKARLATPLVADSTAQQVDTQAGSPFHATELYNRLQVYGGLLLLDARLQDLPRPREAVRVPLACFPEHVESAADKLDFLGTLVVDEAHRTRFRRRRLQQVIVVGDALDEPHYWRHTLQTLLLEERQALSVHILDEPFDNFEKHYPFLCERQPAQQTTGSAEGPGSYPNEISPRLFLGNRRHAFHELTVQNLRVTHVVELHDTDVPAGRPLEASGVKYMTIGIDDVEGADLSAHFTDVYEFINNAHAESTSNCVLVHCNHGVSRSATCVIYYLMRQCGMNASQAIRHAHKAREQVHPNAGFVAQLLAAERQLMPNNLSTSESLGVHSSRGALYLDQTKDQPTKPGTHKCCIM